MTRLLIALLFVVNAEAVHPAPGFIGAPVVVTDHVGDTIFSGTTTTTLATNRDSIYYQTNVAAGGLLPIYTVAPTPISYVNITPSIASYDGATLTFLASGSSYILLYYGFPDRLVTSVLWTYGSLTNSAGTNYLFVTNVVGSLAHHVSTNTYSRMTGDAATKRDLFTTRNTLTTNYVRNPDHFLADVDGLEAYIAGNNSGAFNMNGCLISPRHILSVWHIGSQLGQTVFFVNRTNNEVLARTVIDYARVNLDSDQTVGLLNEPLPDSIVPAATLTNILGFLPQYTNNIGAASFLCRLPVVVFNQTESPGVSYLTSMANGYFGVLTNTTSAWTWELRPGDSGSPCGMVVSNRLCIVGNWTGGCCGTGGGTCTPLIRADVQAAMDLLCSRNSFGNETLQTIPQGGFTNY